MCGDWVGSHLLGTREFCFNHGSDGVAGGKGGGTLEGRGAEATVIRHSENGDLGDGATPALHTAGSLIDGGQVCVHISGEATASWHFLSGS